jgi:aminoglycoside 3-N-acetyltransferase I
VLPNPRLLWWGLTPRLARREVDENAVEAPEGRVNDIVVRRLGAADVELALDTFRFMAEVFDEGGGPLSAEYAATLLRRPDFWALTALEAGKPIGGITAHVLPMTRQEARELFIYDLAVRATHQRRGVGRCLVETLCSAAAAAGVSVAFVPADVEDEHAVAFYRALGGDAAPVTIFTFEQPTADRRAAS